MKRHSTLSMGTELEPYNQNLFSVVLGTHYKPGTPNEDRTHYRNDRLDRFWEGDNLSYCWRYSQCILCFKFQIHLKIEYSVLILFITPCFYLVLNGKEIKIIYSSALVRELV